MLQRLFVYAFFAFPFIIGIAAWAISRRRESRRSGAGDKIEAAFTEKSNALNPVLGFVAIGFFPGLLFVYQLLHGPKKSTLVFIIGYIFIAAAVGSLIDFGLKEIMKNHLQKPGHLGVRRALEGTMFLAASIYVAWMAAAVLRLVGIWRGNVQIGNLMEGFLGLAAALIFALYMRSAFGRTYPIWLVLAIGASAAWIIVNVVFNQMPFLSGMFNILKKNASFLIRGDEWAIRIFFFLECLLCQVVAPIAVIVYAISKRQAGKAPVAPAAK